MIIITDNLIEPFDEGAKITTKSLIEYLQTSTHLYVFSLNSNAKLSFVDCIFFINKLLLNLSFYKTIRAQKTNTILYIPSASASVFSVIRSKLLCIFTKKKVYLLALQPRKHLWPSRFLIKIIHPKLIITLSQKTTKNYNTYNIPSLSLPLGADDKKYFEFEHCRKKIVRDRFGIAQEKTVLLHVGHIQQSRNLDWLINVKKERPEFEIIIVGSTFNAQDDKALHTALHKEGIKIFREYIPNMVDIYNLADFYVFPVLRHDGAIETPLSVLEAMACNLPVITTKFGSLPDSFKPDEDFFYIDSSDEIVRIITSRKKKTCNNRAKIEPFTWERIAQKIIEVVEG